MIEIRIDASGLRALQGECQRLRSGIPRAIAQGLGAGGDRVRTKVQRALYDQTGPLRYSSITSRVRTIRPFAGVGAGGGFSASYVIVVDGKAMDIKEFPVAVNSAGVEADVWNVEHEFQRSFQQKFRGGLMARLTTSRFPIRKLKGPNLAKEVNRGDVPAAFYGAVAEFVAPAILGRLAKLLGRI